MRWSVYKQHPDLVCIQDFLPERPGLEVLYAIESSMYAGLYMVDVSTGKILWKLNHDDDPRWTHAHHNWVADLWDGSPGIECVTNREGHGDKALALFSAQGKTLLDPFPSGYMPVEWNGDSIRELITGDGKIIGRFNGTEVVPLEGILPNPLNGGGIILVADLCGDMRDELVLNYRDPDGAVRIGIITATTPLAAKQVSPLENLDYRLWLTRNMGGGYASTFPRP